MSPARRRNRNRRESGAATTPATQAAQAALPTWHWRTFPVFFAASVALFIGVWVGVIVGASDNETAYSVIFLVIALPLSLGMARIWSRFMIRRGWIKPKAR